MEEYDLNLLKQAAVNFLVGRFAITNDDIDVITCTWDKSNFKEPVSGTGPAFKWNNTRYDIEKYNNIYLVVE